MLKCALYARISKDEVGKIKYSIPAQISRLEEYAKNHNFKIFDTYVDNGLSAGTITKRKGLLKLLDNLDEFDVILFTQLDRFSRNVLDANQLIKRFKDKSVAFKAIDEDDVDTTTADGKFIFDLKVSLAERERMKTSERIKRVNEFKIQNKNVVFGVGPLGYKVQDKKWVLSDDAPMIYDMFDTYIKTGSRQAVRTLVSTKYNKDMCPATVSHYLRREAYTGLYKGIENYYPAIINKSMWEDACRLRNKMHVRNRDPDRVYLFRGLVRCKYCGHIMTGAHAKSKPTASVSIVYRCTRKNSNIGSKEYCSTMHQVREKVIESYLLDNITKEFESYKVELNSKTLQMKKNEIDVRPLNNKLSRLQELYINNLIDMDSYKKEYSLLNRQLDEAEKTKTRKEVKDLKPIATLLDTFVRKEYQRMSIENRRYFWQQMIDYIEVDKNKDIKVYFKT
ncbi:MAG: recombinase family protein [Anaerorhabdus sp.]|uniref:recombinase family protein n=1 Tax=Anaerorhabdus sp. TaxID=1872524 RepID=UPI003A89D71F